MKLHTLISGLAAALQSYPSDLIIQIKDGVVTTNYDLPYFFWLDVYQNKHLLGVVDVSALPQKIDQYNANFLITGREIVFKNSSLNNEITNINLDAVGDKTIDKQTVDRLYGALLSIKKMFFILYSLVVLVLFILFYLMSFTTTVIYLLISSAFIYALYIFKVMKSKIRILQIFQISLHSSTLPLILIYMFFLFSFPLGSLKLIFLLLVTSFTLIGISEGYNYEPLQSKFRSPHHKKK